MIMSSGEAQPAAKKAAGPRRITAMPILVAEPAAAAPAPAETGSCTSIDGKGCRRRQIRHTGGAGAARLQLWPRQ